MSSPTPQPMTESDAKLWAMLAQLSGIIGCILVIAPLIIMLVFGPRNEFVKKQSKSALNFQITELIALVALWIIGFMVGALYSMTGFGLFGLLGGLLYFLLIVVHIGALVLYIIAGIKVYQGEDYRYPISLQLVK